MYFRYAQERLRRVRLASTQGHALSTCRRWALVWHPAINHRITPSPRVCPNHPGEAAD